MRWAAAALAAVALAGALAGPAAAHPRATATSPEAGAILERPPAAVVVRLSEPATPVAAGISVTGPDGLQAARGALSVDGATLRRPVDVRQHGSYVVTWTVIGEDAHPARGVFVFSVGSRTATAAGGGARLGTLLQALGRLLSLTGFALGFGVPFAALVSGGMTRRLWRLVNAAIVLLVVAEPVALLGQTATLAPSHAFDPGLAGDVLLTGYGHVTGLRLGAAIALWALAGALRDASPRAQWGIPLAGAVVALVQANGGHRLPGVPSALSVLLEGAHAAAFAAWAGCVVVAVAERRGGRLARTASLSALLLVASGAGLALGQLGGVGDLLHTAYAQALGLKVAVAAAVLALGAVAWRRAELAGALLLVALVGVLVSLTPPA